LFVVFRSFCMLAVCSCRFWCYCSLFYEFKRNILEWVAAVCRPFKGPLEEVAAINLARPLAYADQTFFYRSLELSMPAFQSLTALPPPSDSALCHTSAPPTTHTPPQPPPTLHRSACARPTTTSWPQVNKLQAPVGTLAFQAAYADACADQACLLMDNLQALPLHQDRWLLLQNNLQQQVAHLSRGSQWDHVGQAVWRAESKAVDGVLLIQGRAWEEEQITEQITLPLRHWVTGPVPSQAALTLAPQTLLPHKVHAYRPQGIPLVGRRGPQPLGSPT
jgi:hypothetical protein